MNDKELNYKFYVNLVYKHKRNLQIRYMCDEEEEKKSFVNYSCFGEFLYINFTLWE